MPNKHLLLMLSVFINSYFLALSASAKEQNALTYFTHVPDKWRSEVISFPLDFAPSIEYRGKLELLFSPGMFDQNSDEFLSYGFIWAIEGTRIPSTEALERDLETYYFGLQSVVSKNTLKNKTKSRVKLSESLSKQSLAYEGIIEWTEPFVTQNAQTLNFNVSFHTDKESNQWFGFFRVSPNPLNHIVWDRLNALPVTFLSEH